MQWKGWLGTIVSAVGISFWLGGKIYPSLIRINANQVQPTQVDTGSAKRQALSGCVSKDEEFGSFLRANFNVKTTVAGFEKDGPVFQAWSLECSKDEKYKSDKRLSCRVYVTEFDCGPSGNDSFSLSSITFDSSEKIAIDKLSVESVDFENGTVSFTMKSPAEETYCFVKVEPGHPGSCFQSGQVADILQVECKGVFKPLGEGPKDLKIEPIRKTALFRELCPTFKLRGIQE